VTAVATFMGVLFVPAGLLSADASQLFITEYVEGSASNQAIELYNPGSMAVNLQASGYSLLILQDGSTAVEGFVALSGQVPAGGTWVVASASAGAALLAKANQTASTTWFDGNDVVALVQGGTAVDVIGKVGEDPGSYWGTGDVTTQDHTLRRKASVTAGDPNGADAFDPALQWDGYAQDTFDGLGWVGSSVNQPVALTCPASVETTQGIAASAPVSATDPDGTVTSLAVTSVNPDDPGTIAVVGVTAAGAAGGMATGSLSVSPSTPIGSYTVTVGAANDDAAPQTGSCDIAVAVSPATPGSLRALVSAMTDDGDVAAAKAPLLQQRLDRIDAAMAAGRTADAAAQLQAFANQVAGLSPRWIAPDAAGQLVEQAAAVAAAL
jgi:hypothetical protein